MAGRMYPTRCDHEGVAKHRIEPVPAHGNTLRQRNPQNANMPERCSTAFNTISRLCYGAPRFVGRFAPASFATSSAMSALRRSADFT